ncbi:MAG TPA: hypothetical protein VF263_24050, partial [Longimicrobiaceae bacterium]
MTRCYVYGRGDAEVFALLKDTSFNRLLQSLFDGGSARPISGAEEEVASRATAAGLLQGNSSGYAPGPRLVPIPGEASRDVAERMAPALDRYAGIAAEAAGGLRSAFGRTSAARSLPWSQVEHSLVAGMLLDLSVGSRLWLDGHIHRGYQDTLVWAFEETPGQNAFG